MEEKRFYRGRLEPKELLQDEEGLGTKDVSSKRNARRIKALIVCLSVGTVLLLAACAPRSSADSASDENGGKEASSATTAAWWSPESDCATCHENSASTLASLSCEAAAADNPSQACAHCHDDTVNLETAHAEVSLSDTAGDDTYLKVSAIQEETCLTCHKREDLIAATAAVTDLTDLKKTTINPHEASTVYNVNGAHDTITCGSCHKMHSGGTPATGKVAYDFCIECHHTGEFVCNTCH